MITERSFFIELSEIITGKHQDKPLCISSKGKAPKQVLSEEEFSQAQKLTLDENFYGDEDFDADELDEEGFGDMNFDDSSLFSEDPRF